MPLPFPLYCLGLVATQFGMALGAPHPLLGPVFQPPTNPSNSSHISLALSNLREQLANNLQNGMSSFGNFTPNATSVSVTIISTFEEDPLFDFHFASPLLGNGTEGVSKIDSGSIYRIGSISKLLTVYALLLNGAEAVWSRPVTDFIPEIKDIAERGINNGLDRMSDVMWDQVTIGALASQLSGIGRECKLHSKQSVSTNLYVLR